MPSPSSENVVLSREQLREELRALLKEDLKDASASVTPIKKAVQNYDEAITRIIKLYEDVRDPVPYEKVEQILKSTLATTTQPVKDVTALTTAFISMPLLALRAAQCFDGKKDLSDSFIEIYKTTAGQLVAPALSLAALPCEVTKNVLKSAATVAKVLNNYLKTPGGATAAPGQPSPEIRAVLTTQLQMLEVIQKLAANSQKADAVAPVSPVVSFRSARAAREDRSYGDSEPAAREDVARTALRA